MVSCIETFSNYMLYADYCAFYPLKWCIGYRHFLLTNILVHVQDHLTGVSEIVFTVSHQVRVTNVASYVNIMKYYWDKIACN